MAFLFGFEINLLELMLFFEIVLIISLAALFWELRKLKKLVDEAYQIEKMHSEEGKGRK